MEIKFDITFTGAVAPALFDAVASRLRPLLPELQRSAPLQVGDSLLVAGKHLRVVARTWYMNSAEPMLEFRLTVD